MARWERGGVALIYRGSLAAIVGLAALRGPSESYSDVILRLIEIEAKSRS
jgi:hypothetical protein